MKTLNSIASAAGLMAASILLSRVLGYLREMLLAYAFGAGFTTDAFYAAFQIPDLLNYFLAGGALSIAFIPLFNQVLLKEGEGAAQHLMGVILGTMGVIAAATTAVLWWQAPLLMHLQFPKFSSETAQLSVELTRIVLPAQIFFITGGIVQAVLLARKSFVAAALSPLIYNLCIIAGGYFLYPFIGIQGFALGTLMGAILGPFLIPILHLRDYLSWCVIRFSLRDRHVYRYLIMAAPLMLGQTLLTVDEWYGRWFGALLSEGAVSYLSYARRLVQVPVAVIGQAMAAAALPTLSQLWAAGKVEEMNAALTRTVRVGLFLSILAAAACCVAALPAVIFVYERGKFSGIDSQAVAGLVAIMAFALPGWTLQQIIVRGFYARGDTWQPMILGTILCLLAAPLYFWLGRFEGIRGLALAGVVGMGLSAMATVGLAVYLYRAPVGKVLVKTFIRSLGIAILAGSAAKGALIFRAHSFDLFGLTRLESSMIDLFFAGFAFVVSAVAGVLLIGEEDMKGFLKALSNKK